MKSFLKFVLIFAGILLISAALAPVLFRFLPFKFERIFNRLVMIQTLALVFWAVWKNPQMFRGLGYADRSRAGQNFGLSFISGLGVLFLLYWVKSLFGAAEFRLVNMAPGALAMRVTLDLFAALLIALIEEFFFRGVIFSYFRRSGMQIVLAVLVTSAVYSSLHFVGGGKPFIGPEPGFREGLQLVAAPFMAFTKWKEFWPDAAGLFFFGMVLNLLLLRTGSLYASMGLHAGCVFFVKLDALFADSLNVKNWVWGSSKMYDGLAGWIFIAGVGAFLLFVLKGTTRPTQQESRL